jgi:hypothetical protein
LSPEGVSLRRATNPLSPDGKFVLGQGRGKASLYPIQGGPARPVAGLDPGDVPVQWSEDGHLFVHRRTASPHKVWLLDPVSGMKRPWLEINAGEGGDGVDLLVTRDGKSYVWGARLVLSELYVVEGLR